MKRPKSDAKAGLQGSPSNAGGMDFSARRMMGNNDNLLAVAGKGLVFQPPPRFHVKTTGIGGL